MIALPRETEEVGVHEHPKHGTVLRCKVTIYTQQLAHIDAEGIWFWCKDCRSAHCFTWPAIEAQRARVAESLKR